MKIDNNLLNLLLGDLAGEKVNLSRFTDTKILHHKEFLVENRFVIGDVMRGSGSLQAVKMERLTEKGHTRLSLSKQQKVTPIKKSINTSIVSVDLFKMAEWISQYFNLADVKVLCFKLDVEYENLEGQTLVEKAQSLVTHARNRDRINDLIKGIASARESQASSFIDAII